MPTILKCKMCGGDIEVSQDMTVGTCLYCGSTMTLPRIDSEKKARLFNRANQYRQECEFDKAYRAYEAILEEDEQESEAYWGLILAEYGVEYVEEPKTKKRIPTCHRTQTKFIQNSTNYEMACKYADPEMRIMYEDEAEQLDKIQKRIISVSTKEEPYDVFICYKETDDATGERTQDSVLGYEIYEALTKRNIRTFMSRVTLADKLGEDYEPYIYSALSSARVMIVVATNGDHLDAVWVKNEWMRYLSFMKEDENKIIIPVYKDMSPYEFPNELTRFQAQDMSKVGAEQDLVMGIQKLLGSVKADNTSAQIRNLVDETNKRDKRTKTTIAVLSSLLVGIIIIGGFYVYKTSSAGKYKAALHKMENHDYYDAASILSGLGYYKDSYELFTQCSVLASYARVQDRYKDIKVGENIEFGSIDDNVLTWTCLESDDDQVILLSDGVFTNNMRYANQESVLDNLGIAFSDEEQGVLDSENSNGLSTMTEEQLNLYLPNVNDRIGFSLKNSVPYSWYIKGGMIDESVPQIEYIDAEGNFIKADMSLNLAEHKNYAGFRPLLSLSKETITVIP